jgi:hypothetical protein
MPYFSPSPAVGTSFAPRQTMVTAIPWSELAHTARRIARLGGPALWLCQDSEGTRAISVHCYPSADFRFAGLLADDCDLPGIWAHSHQLRISSGDETLLVSFHPQAAPLSNQRLKDTVFVARGYDISMGGGRAGPAPVLIFGLVDSVELQVPSHAIDVIAPLRRPAVSDAVGFFGLN